MNENHSAPDHAPRVITRLARAFETGLSDGQAMSLPQYRLLAFLSEGEWAASALADWLSVSRPSVTSLVDGLVERGWVTREHSPEDRRRVLHHLTAEGRTALAGASTLLSGVLDGLLDHLDDGERTQVLAGLSLLHVAMRRHHEAVVSS